MSRDGLGLLNFSCGNRTIKRKPAVTDKRAKWSSWQITSSSHIAQILSGKSFAKLGVKLKMILIEISCSGVSYPRINCDTIINKTISKLRCFQCSTYFREIKLTKYNLNTECVIRVLQKLKDVISWTLKLNPENQI